MNCSETRLPLMQFGSCVLYTDWQFSSVKVWLKSAFSSTSQGYIAYLCNVQHFSGTVAASSVRRVRLLYQYIST